MVGGGPKASSSFTGAAWSPLAGTVTRLLETTGNVSVHGLSYLLQTGYAEAPLCNCGRSL